MTGPVVARQVRDKEGRRRFHGAFTGGFSAGYYNTVGSAEGWTPAQFSSSRSQRSEARQQRPEDFMDEDDDPLLGRKLSTRDEFDTLGKRAESRAVTATPALGRSAIPGRVPSELIVPSSVPVGKKLLRCMGWREGQGLGPRVLRERRKRRKRKQQQQQQQQEHKQERQEQQAAAPGATPGADEESEEVDSDATPPVAPTSLSTRPAPTSTSAGVGTTTTTKKKAVYTVAMPPGVGARATADSDSDDDPYAQGILFAPKNTAAISIKQKVGGLKRRMRGRVLL